MNLQQSDPIILQHMGWTQEEILLKYLKMKPLSINKTLTSKDLFLDSMGKQQEDFI